MSDKKLIFICISYWITMLNQRAIKWNRKSLGGGGKTPMKSPPPLWVGAEVSIFEVCTQNFFWLMSCEFVVHKKFLVRVNNLRARLRQVQNQVAQKSEKTAKTWYFAEPIKNQEMIIWWPYGHKWVVSMQNNPFLSDLCYGLEKPNQCARSQIRVWKKCPFFTKNDLFLRHHNFPYIWVVAMIGVWKSI